MGGLGSMRNAARSSVQVALTRSGAPIPASTRAASEGHTRKSGLKSQVPRGSSRLRCYIFHPRETKRERDVDARRHLGERYSRKPFLSLKIEMCCLNALSNLL